MARGLCAASSPVLRQNSSRQQAKACTNVSKVNKEATGLEVDNSCGGIGDLLLLLEFRNKIIAFRDTLDLPPCADTTAIPELIMQTLEDLKKLHPSIWPNIKERKEVSPQQYLSCLYEALKSMGDIWAENHMLAVNSFHSAYGSSNAMNSKQLGGRVIEKLDNRIKAGRQNFDIMHEDWKSDAVFSRELSSDIKNTHTCPSPASPSSVPPDLMKLGAHADASSSFPPLLQAVEKCISSNIFPVVSVQGVPVKERKEEEDECTVNFSKTKTTAEESPIIATNEVSTSPKSVINPEINLSDMLKAKRPKESSRSLSLPSIPTPQPIMAPPPPIPTAGISLLHGTAPRPPPPPGIGAPKVLGLKRSNSRLRRSSHMGNLYRNLKRKLEGSNVVVLSNNTKPRVGGVTSVKQGMAEALAEMTKRSAYFHQIEEDVHKHSQMIMKLRDDIYSFKTKDMSALRKFHRDVEQHLEELSDETQVLARFDDFPTKKLESLRIAAAMHSKLEGIADNLEHWEIKASAEQHLDKVESYFNKIKGDIEALDRSKEEDSKHFQSQDIDFDFNILIRIKEHMVDVSSGCMELALKERSEATEGKRQSYTKLLWRAFQLAFRVYSFAGGQDDRADRLTKELGGVLDSHAQNQ